MRIKKYYVLYHLLAGIIGKYLNKLRSLYVDKFRDVANLLWIVTMKNFPVIRLLKAREDETTSLKLKTIDILYAASLADQGSRVDQLQTVANW